MMSTKGSLIKIHTHVVVRLSSIGSLCCRRRHASELPLPRLLTSFFASRAFVPVVQTLADSQGRFG